MNKFPVDNVKTKFNQFYYETSLPVFTWGKKLFIYINQEMRAAIPLYSYIAASGSDSSIARFVGFNIAGMGKVNLREGSYRLFLTPGHYDSYAAGNKSSEYNPPRVEIGEIVRSRGFNTKESSCWDRVILGWYFDKFHGTPEQIAIKFQDLWIDEDGTHITVVPESHYSNGTKCYLTKQECINDNKPKVYDFDDDFVEPKFSDYTIPVKLTVKATSKEDAENKIREICGSTLTI